MYQFNILTTSESGPTDRLGDRKCRAEGNELYRDEEKNARLAHAVERLIVWCHRAISEEVLNFSSNAVPRKLIKAHVPANEANFVISIILETHAGSRDTYNKPASTPTTGGCKTLNKIKEESANTHLGEPNLGRARTVW